MTPYWPRGLAFFLLGALAAQGLYHLLLCR